MRAKLKIIAGPDLGRTFAIEPGQTLVVGRGQSSNTWLSDPFVSRVHCLVQEAGGRFILLDAGSSTGVTVNGTRVHEHALGPDDRIAIGDTVLVFSREGPSGFDDSGLVRCGMAEPSTSSRTKLSDLVGQQVHHYQIKKVIGQGASGMVFGALDIERNRPAALKVLWPELTVDDDEVQRFIRAMKTMLPLRHPNLVRVYGAGKTHGLCWMAMEYVPGQSLQEVITQIGIAGMLDWRYSFHVTTHVARALSMAHQQKIVHRNISPKNILVRQADKVAKLGDLMLAKAMSGSMAESLTKTGQLIGELAFMAPECTTATTEAEIDERADLYNLGATVYAVLTGRPPFAGSGVVEMIRKIRDERPVAPSTFQMSVFAGFEGAVMRLLAKDPRERFASANELLGELDRIAKFQGITV